MKTFVAQISLNIGDISGYIRTVRYILPCLTSTWNTVKYRLKRIYLSSAFIFFSGVLETVKIDNLKAAIIEANFYKPLVQRTYPSFDGHYGFLSNPCRVYTPTDKGKVKSNFKYVKDN